MTVEDKLVGTIRERGPVTFREFMQTSLYDREAGYYNTDPEKIGPRGDYYTSSSVHSAFGAVLANCFVKLWRGMSDRGNTATPLFKLVEIGGGTGQLARDVIDTIGSEYPDEYDLLQYTIVEISPKMRALQRQRLSEFGSRVRWTDLDAIGDEAGGQFSGIVFSNELIDAFPVHVIRRRNQHLEELYVAVRSPDQSCAPVQGETDAARTPSTRLVFDWAPLSTQRITDYISQFVPPIQDEQRIEVNLAAIDLLDKISAKLKNGFLVTIDYGDLAEHLYGYDRNMGTLRAFRKHTIAPSMLDRPGEQDITASVNFSALIKYGESIGFETISYERQSAFLISNGLIERIAAKMSSEAVCNASLKERLALKNLFVPGGASDNFRVLIQRRI